MMFVAFMLSGIRRKQDDPLSALGKGRRQARQAPDVTGHSMEVQVILDFYALKI